MFGEIVVYPLASIGRLEQELVLVDKDHTKIKASAFGKEAIRFD